MTVLLSPLPDGTADDDAGSRLQQVIAAMNGYAGQGVRFNLTEYSHGIHHGLEVRNKNLGGHFAAYLSSADVATATPIVEITDAGLLVTDASLLVFDGAAPVLSVDGAGVVVLAPYGLTTPTLTSGAALFTGDITTSIGVDVLCGGTLFADQGIDIIGGGTISGVLSLTSRLTSTVATGTAPFLVASTTRVANLNADLLDDRDTGTGVGNIAFYNGSNRVVDSALVGGRQPGVNIGEVAFYDGSGRVVDSQLVDGKEPGVVVGSLAFYDASGRVVDSELVAGKVPGVNVGEIAFYNASGRVVNSELVDGKQPGTGVGDIAFYDASTRVVDSELVAGKVPGTSVGNVAFYNSNTRVVDSELAGGRQPGTSVGELAFYNGSGRVADSVLLGGRQPGTSVGEVAFYDGSNRVADSQKLDGVDGSGYFLSTGGTVAGSVTINNDLVVSSTTQLKNGGNTRFETGGTGISFFGSAQNAKQTVTGSRGGNAALQSLLSALANYGFVFDLSS